MITRAVNESVVNSGAMSAASKGLESEVLYLRTRVAFLENAVQSVQLDYPAPLCKSGACSGELNHDILQRVNIVEAQLRATERSLRTLAESMADEVNVKVAGVRTQWREEINDKLDELKYSRRTSKRGTADLCDRVVASHSASLASFQHEQALALEN